MIQELSLMNPHAELPTTEEDLEHLMHTLTKNDKYFTAALKWIREANSWDPKGLTRINDFGDAMIMESLSSALDVFWDRINENDKLDALNQIVVRGGFIMAHILLFRPQKSSPCFL